MPFSIYRLLRLLLLFMLSVTTVYSQNWSKTTPFPATGRDDGTSFVIGHKAYCGTGLTQGWTAQRDFYVLDMYTDVWGAIAPLPTGNERQYAVGFSANGKGYVFGGVNGNKYFNDVWEYTPTSNSWQKKTSLPTSGRFGAACFVMNDIAYVIGGKTSDGKYIKEVWAYDIQHDSWQQKGDFPLDGSWRASAASVQNKGYLIFGQDDKKKLSNALFEYNPTNDNWTKISSFPRSGRVYSTLQTNFNNLIVIAGMDSAKTFYNDMWRYNLSTNTWVQLQPIPSFGRRGGMAFNNNETVYYVSGVNSNNIRNTEVWKCQSPTSISSLITEPSEISVYPNPASNYIRIDLKNQYENTFISIFNLNGQLVLPKRLIKRQEQLPINHLPEGLYFLQVTSESQNKTIKIIRH